MECLFSDINFFSGNDTENAVKTALHNPIPFESACGVPEFTNYTPLFAACLDYIFYKSDSLKVKQVKNVKSYNITIFGEITSTITTAMTTATLMLVKLGTTISVKTSTQTSDAKVKSVVSA